MTRLETRLSALKAQARKAFVAFITAGDPNGETSAAILAGLPKAGADIIELGMPFTDPMADGPAIQRSGARALKNGQTLAKTLGMVAAFRQNDDETPLVLMGYYNPIYHYGVARFLKDAKRAGVDGLIMVDLPPETDAELCLPAGEAGLHFIRLATPTTDAARLPHVLRHASGFIYYVSIAGITGTAAPDAKRVAKATDAIRQHTDLPIMVGFGIRDAKTAGAMCEAGDGVVIGSALVDVIGSHYDTNNTPDNAPDNASSRACVAQVLALAEKLASAIHA